MADTHINAYFADVDEAEKKVIAAHAEWEAAKTRLEAKKNEVGYEEPSAPVSNESKPEEEVKEETPKPKGNSLFNRK
jgi:hypothetical protein